MIAMTKQQLRRLIRSQAGSDADLEEQSSMLCRHILESAEYRQAAVVCGYMPMRHEANVLPVLRDVIRSGRKLLLPLCGQAPDMTLRVVSSLETLTVGSYGLLEPSPDAPAYQDCEPILLLVPLEGIDRDGYRLGKGGGYYDKLLAKRHSCFSLGCALSWQERESLPHDAWDMPLNACADFRGIQYFRL